MEDADTIEDIRALDIEMEDDTVILSRKITGGRAIGRINGEAVSASKMKAVASLLIDIHGQHEHQSLLSKKKHLEILDTFAKEALGDKKKTYTVLSGVSQIKRRIGTCQSRRRGASQRIIIFRV